MDCSERGGLFLFRSVHYMELLISSLLGDKKQNKQETVFTLDLMHLQPSVVPKQVLLHPFLTFRYRCLYALSKGTPHTVISS